VWYRPVKENMSVSNSSSVSSHGLVLHEHCCASQMSPENSTRSDRHNYQTEILNNLMDHLLAADVLLGDQAALPTSSSSSVTYSHLANNVFYLAGRIVDKLWQGAFVPR